MTGFGDSGLFYEGVDMAQSFERNYRPIDTQTDITPVMLVIILNLYFTLTPNTMVSETPEVLEMASVLGIKPEQIVNVLDVYQTFDPILKRQPLDSSPLVDEAHSTWNEYYNQPELLQESAEKLIEYFK